VTYPGGGRRRRAAVAGVTRRLIADLVARPDRRAAPPPEPASLTGREREVVEPAALGLANHEIAGGLVVSPATVRTHVSRTITKLVAYQTGLVSPGPAPPPG